MAQVDKLIQKVFKSPTPKNIKWGEFLKLLGKLGYKPVNTNGGSHTGFFNEDLDHYFSVPRPHPGNEVKPHYIDVTKKELQDIGVIQE